MNVNETTYEKGFDPIAPLKFYIDCKLSDACLHTIDNILDKMVTDLNIPSKKVLEKEIRISNSAKDYFQNLNNDKSQAYVKEYGERIDIMEELLKKLY
ncbi:hypothetical protein C0585_06200 [Candidatus Woesearchaeota archaeon]|nr:MAG: hypothetical protein C0585_06200 [Candidatus Woesearchaeota archaeon]